METTLAIPADVARKLGYYVYLPVNPLDEAVFYVGKGQGKRALIGDRWPADDVIFNEVTPQKGAAFEWLSEGAYTVDGRRGEDED